MEEEEKNGRPGKKKSTKRRKRTGGKRETKEKRGGKKTKRNRRMKISRHRSPILLSIFFFSLSNDRAKFNSNWDSKRGRPFADGT